MAVPAAYLRSRASLVDAVAPGAPHYGGTLNQAFPASRRTKPASVAAVTGQAADPVTLLITRRVVPGCHRDFQAWLRQGTLLAAGFPGFLGSGVLSPSEGSDTFQVMMRFADEASLRCWELSLSRRMWLDRGAALMQSTELQRVDGLELIFGRIEQDDGGPARWQRAIMVWMFLFPIALSLNFLLFSLLPGMPVVLRVMATTMVQVPMMIYVGAPLINRLWRTCRQRRRAML